MRADALGMFWEDLPPVKKAKAEKEKRTPPEPTWLAPDYLPGLDEALAFNIHVMTDQELVAAAFRDPPNRQVLVFDIECYTNYFLVAFKDLKTGHIAYFEKYQGQPLDYERVNWIVHNFTIVGFNSRSYDMPILALALAGETNEVLKFATNQIIKEGYRPYEVLREYKAKELTEVDHIDLIEVTPLRASLKIYGGRLHAPRMQDLPFHPDSILSFEQIAITRWYCVNDLIQTEMLHNSLLKQLDLRVKLGREYATDLRSRSDAQIAESVIASEVAKLNGYRAKKPVIEPGTPYKYRVPHFINYETPLMNRALEIIRNANFIVGPGGNVGMPEELKELHIPIANSVYRMGIGGLHSSEKCVAHYADDHTLLIDRDVTSYYPAIILNLGLYPLHLGPNFLRVYSDIVDRRLKAKRSGDKVTADSLKITINGSFGKLGSRFSVLYSPDLLIQVTVTGQLSLLMLIERLELRGIPVVSANTDGLVIKCPKHRQPDMQAIIEWWERDTNFGTEETLYRALFSRDVNNYIAVKTNGDIKAKGVYSKPGLQKNPTNLICVEAVKALVTEGVPIHETIRGCTDIRKFVTVRTVKGGAVKDGVYLGKSIRWYYATGVEGEIVYALSGNKVPRSDGAKPLMDLPQRFPVDINYEWYEQEAFKIAKEIAFYSE